MTECAWLYLLITLCCVIIVFVTMAYRKNVSYLEQRIAFLNRMVAYMSEKLMENAYDDKAMSGAIKNGGKSEIKVEEGE